MDAAAVALVDRLWSLSWPISFWAGTVVVDDDNDFVDEVVKRAKTARDRCDDLWEYSGR